MSRNEGSADAPHLPSEAEVIVSSFESVSMAKKNPRDADAKCESYDPTLRCANSRPYFWYRTIRIRGVG